MDDSVSRVRRTLAVQVLSLEMVKAYATLATEVEVASEPEEERLLIADFADLDLRLAPLAVFVEMEEPLLIDDDELGLLAAEIQYLKVRMGLGDDFYTGTVDWPRVKKSSRSPSPRPRRAPNSTPAASGSLVGTRSTRRGSFARPALAARYCRGRCGHCAAPAGTC
eukprot:TRINITY_DN1717_c0_g1_i2.p3 TRINITY_DN1717_c0_g1~~TRINITY_DN1717_c0_g1_i2.p3  ORF type:complete len:166 (-),score=50.42 TRINITY_DN1717_c0_g1_i2:61-558(-)